MSNNTTIVVYAVNTKVLDNVINLSFNHNMKLGERLKQARAYAKISQEELALRLNASQSLISKIERGEQDETTLVVKMAKICNVSIEWLDDGTGEMITSSLPYKNSPEAMILIAMQPMDERTKYQAVKIVNTLAEPAEKPNGTLK